MKRICSVLLSAALFLIAFPSCSDDGLDYARLNRQAAKEYSKPIRPGYEGRNPYWNTYSIKFIYTPAFDFPEIEGASSYRFTVYLEDQIWREPAAQRVGKGLTNVTPAYVPEERLSWSFTAKSPKSPLSPIWDKLPQGNMILKVDALDRKGNFLATVGTRKFLRDFPYSGPGEPAARSFCEAADLALKYIHTMPAVVHWRNNDTPDMSFMLNSYACKSTGSVIRLEALVAKRFPRFAKDALAAARNAAAFLMENSFSEDNALAHFPPTYIGSGAAAGDRENANTTMVMEALYPAVAYLDLFDVTKDSLYLNEAIKIADSYAGLQKEDGSIPKKVYIDSGEPVTDSDAMLGDLLSFLRRLKNQYGTDAYDSVINKAEAWMQENPLRTLDFTGQFEDVTVVGWQPYEDFTNCTSAAYVSYLLTGDNPSRDIVSACKDVIDLCEDQLALWNTLKSEDGTCSIDSPCVLEQFTFRMPVDDSACNLGNAWLDYYSVSGDKLALAKALTMAAGITNVQRPESGIIPTVWRSNESFDLWFNCIAKSISFLLRCSEICGEQPQEQLYSHSVFLAGDSSASDYSSRWENGHPVTGWGEMLRFFLKDDVRVVNCARAGRSSKSFVDQGLWQGLIDEVRPGDCVLIEFGHNDSKVADPERYSDLPTFKDYQRRFAGDVLEKGGYPVFLTPTEACVFDGGKLTGGSYEYARATREVAVEMGLPLIDVEKAMSAWLTPLGFDRAVDYFCTWYDSDYGLYNDRTDIHHLNCTGAYEVAGIVAGLLREAAAEPVCGWLSEGDSANDADYDVYLAIGQSNMAGRGYMAFSDTQPVEGVWLLDDEDKPVRARNPYNQYSSVRKRLTMQQISPSYSFSTEMHKATGRPVLMVVNARGGTSIDQWAPDSTMYKEAVRRTKEAVKYGTLKGVIWHQGCSDLDSAKEYPAKIKALVANLRRDLGDETLPFIAGGLPPYVDGTSDFNRALEKTMLKLPNCGYVSSRELRSRSNSYDPHYNRASQIELGRRYAVRMLELKK